MAFHPETDGISERTNQWVEGFLRTFCNYRQDDWSKWLPIAEFCHNHHRNAATGMSAFEAVYGRNPVWNLFEEDIGQEGNVLAAEGMHSVMTKVWDEAIASMELHQGIRSPIEGLSVGDKVWLLLTDISSKRPSKKLDNRKGGPFTITEKISSHAYRLDLPKTMKVHDVFHINLLTRFKEDEDFHRQQAKPPPIITEGGEEEYEIDHIVAWEWRKGKLLYQIRWKGYDPIEDTMERAEKFSDLPELLNDLARRLPNAPMPGKDESPNDDSNKRAKKSKRVAKRL
jgi:flagellar biosynthesis regulator FlaF